MNKHLKSLFSATLVAVFVSVIYLVFESAVAHSVDMVWLEWLNTPSNRLAVIPLTISLGLAYFWALHLAEQHKSKDQNLLITLGLVLFVGFMSLFSGASLGPEAVLIPASMLSGLIIAKFVNTKNTNLLSLAGFVALFVAFFNSILGGALGLYMSLKSKPQKLTASDYAILAVSAVVALLTLNLLSGAGAFIFPKARNTLTITNLLLTAVFFATGILYHRLFAGVLKILEKFKKRMSKDWFALAIISSCGLAIIFLLGGEYVQFTGNEFIKPILHEAGSIGLVGLLWISIVKIVAMAWSTTMGYRGGLVFPMVFVASSAVAIVTLYTTNFNIITGIFVFLAGVLVADKKSQVILGHTTG